MNTLIEANLSCLRQGIALLEEIPCDFYSRKCPGVFSSSIGGHFRHNLDHYQAFHEGYARMRVDYDARQRDAAIENDPEAARDAMLNMVSFLQTILNDDLDSEMQVRMDDGGDASWSRSSLRRELQFLLSHTIHHHALVVSIATQFGFTRFPAGFGIAPSTLHHRDKLEV